MGRRSAGDLSELLKATEGVDIHSGYLRIRITVARKRHTIPLGLEPTKANILHAGRKYQAAKAAVREGTFRWDIHFPGHEPAEARASRVPTFGVLVEHWLASKKGTVAVSTYDAYVRGVAVLFQVLSPDLDVDQLTPAVLERARSELSHQYNVKTVNHKLTLLGMLVGYARKNGWLSDRLQTYRVSKVKDVVQAPDPFDDESELVPALRLLAEDDPLRWFVLFVRFTGLRLGEACAVAWEDISFERQELVVRRNLQVTGSKGSWGFLWKSPKNWRSRVVPLYPPALAALERMRGLTEHLPARTIQTQTAPGDRNTTTETIRVVFRSFHARGDLLYPHAINERWKRLCAKSGVRYRNAYNLRHTFVCWSLTIGVAERLLAEVIGHANTLLIHKVYGKWMERGRAAEVLRTWDRHQTLLGTDAVDGLLVLGTNLGPIQRI